MPTNTVQRLYSRICSLPLWHGFVSNKDWVPARTRFRFKNKLLSLDSTTISLCLTMFPWAKFRRAKGGVKAHVLLDHDDYLPAYVLLTEAKRSDVKLADSFRLNPGSIVAIDRGYIDYALFARWSMAGVFFVTRLKENTAFEVVEECAIPQNSNIRADQLIRLTGAQAQADYPELLRRIVAWDAENEREIVLLTNLLEFGATTIAAIYKERWQIELFFDNSTWCTPSDVIEFQGSVAPNRPLVGSLVVPFSHTSLDVWPAQNPRRAHTGLRRRQQFHSNQPQNSRRRDAEDGGSLADGDFAAGLPLSLTVDRNRMVVPQRADMLRSPDLSVCRAALIPI